MARVLVVDDDRILSCVLEEIIMDMGHDVLSASNGAACLDIVRRTAPLDMVLLDYDLYDTTGEAVLKTIRSGNSWQHVPVVFVTGNPDAINEIPKSMYQALITKPFDVASLVGVVQSLVS